MEPSALALFTTSELIDELVRRQTFLGVVLHSEEELKAAGWQGTRMFRVRFNGDNLCAEEVHRLLGAIAEQIPGDDQE